ncbi:hypothetical protein ACQI4F_03680 [Mycolicibacterium vaccae]|uniref:hypothetical protein n=1 Tax=Mycolicibacterium vaccae TaxID=1810 RepID=UPI003CF4CE54
MKQHAAILGGLLTAVLLSSLLVLPTAGGQPVETSGLATDPTLPLSQLGSRPNLAFYGAQGTEMLVLPVSPGLAPVALNAVTQLPVNVRSATLTIMQDDRTIGRVDVTSNEPAPITVPLTGVVVEDNAVSLMLRTYLLSADGYCLDPSNPLRLSDVSVSYAGVERPPTTVADFLPPVLRGLSIFVGDDPSSAEASAAVRLATAVAAQYGPQNPEITVRPLADGQTLPAEPSGPLQRQIVIREEPDAGVRLANPEIPGVPPLLITGPPEQLANQSRLLSSDVRQLALASKAVVGPLDSTPQLPPNETTLRRLGQPGVNATALSPQVNISLDQTRLGRSVRGVRLHLRGDHTPLPDNIGGQVVVSVAGETIDRWPADPSGVVDRWVQIPDEKLQRYTNLGVRLNISGDIGQCAQFEPLTLTIDGDSPVISSLAQPPLPGGLQSLPQALMPRTTVGIGAGFDDTRRAVALMVGLQRLSALPIDPVLTSVDEAIDSPGPAVVISADGWDNDRIPLPLAFEETGELTLTRTDAEGEDPVTLTVTPALPYASLQTVSDGDRTVLIATSDGVPAQLDALLDWVAQNPQRWGTLDGTALIAPPDREPLVFGTAAAPPSGEETAAGPPNWVWAAAALGAVLLVLVIDGAGRRARRRGNVS